MSKIDLPQRVKDKIDCRIWLFMCSILNNHCVQYYKYHLSEEKGMDVGVPATIDMMLSRDRSHFRGVDRALMIEGYLLGTDFVSPLWVRTAEGSESQTGIVPDEHGANQLEGELRRYWANKHRIDNPRSVQLTQEILIHYCTEHNLLGEPFNQFSRKLGFLREQT